MKIALCGSARFEREFKDWNKHLTLVGHIVYSLSVYPSDEVGKDWYTPEQKLILDLAHIGKIDASDAIVVCNVGGYVGDSTSREILHAIKSGKEVYYIEWISDDNPAQVLLNTGDIR
jgi:hypothetical protein